MILYKYFFSFLQYLHLLRINVIIGLINYTCVSHTRILHGATFPTPVFSAPSLRRANTVDEANPTNAVWAHTRANVYAKTALSASVPSSEVQHGAVLYSSRDELRLFHVHCNTPQPHWSWIKKHRARFSAVFLGHEFTWSSGSVA